MFDEHHKVSIWSRMELLIDYTATPRKPDTRIVELFGQAPQYELVIHESPLLCGME